jgi:hypothetical protein
MLEPTVGDAFREVVHVANRKAPQPGGERVVSIVVGDPESALELDLESGLSMDLWKGEHQGVSA